MNKHAGENPKISGYLYSSDDTSRIDLTTADFVQNSLTIRKSTSEAGEITVGAVIIDGCDFKLINWDKKFDNWHWKNSGVSITLTYSDGESVYMGQYFIISHKSRGNVIDVEALDARKVMDIHQLYELNISYPIDAVELIEKLTTAGLANITTGGLDDLKGTLQVSDPGDDQMTNRDAISYLAQCLGKFSILKQTEEGNTLWFDWYDFDTVTDVGNTFSHDVQTTDITVTKIKITANDDETVVERGTDGYTLEINGNPFITADNIETVADNIEAAVVGMTFRAGTFSILSDPSVNVGSVITVSTPQEKNIKTIVTNMTYKPGSVRESVTADAPETPDDLQISQAEYVKRVIKSELNNPNSDLSQAIGSGESGEGGGYTPGEVYAMRPKDWLKMPEPVDNEIYLLCMIPEGSELVDITSTLTLISDNNAKGEIAYGTVENGTFVSKRTEEFDGSSDNVYIKLSFTSSECTDTTSDGLRQMMVKISISGIIYWSMSGNSLDYTYEACAKLPDLITLDFSGSSINTSPALRYFTLRGSNKIESISDTFRYLDSLLTIRELDTSGCKDFYRMFEDCRSLMSVPSFDLSGLLSTGYQLSHMFHGCGNLGYVGTFTNIPNFSIRTDYMFCGCTELTEIPKTGISFTKLSNVEYMFSGCTKLKKISDLDVSNSTNCAYLFQNCRYLTESGNIKFGKDARYAFANCEKLEKVSNITYSVATRSDYIFQNCYKLTKIGNISGSELITNFAYAFQQCRSLVNMPDLDFTSATNISYMFNNCMRMVAGKMKNIGYSGKTVTVGNYVFTNTALFKFEFVNAENWVGANLVFTDCHLSRENLVALFNSLPTITTARNITITGNGGYVDLTDEDKAIATNKNWNIVY